MHNSSELEKFRKTNTSILKPEVAFAIRKAIAEVESGMFKQATYSPSYNRQLEREYIANARRNAGAKY